MTPKRLRAVLLQIARILRWAADAVAKLGGVVTEKDSGKRDGHSDRADGDHIHRQHIRPYDDPKPPG